VIELHRRRAAALRGRAEARRVLEHRRERHERGDDARVAAFGHTCDVAAAAVEVADDVAHVLLRDDDLDLHDRLDDDRAAAVDGILQRQRARDLERHLVRVDVVLRAVDDGHLEVDDRVAGDHAVLHRFLHAGLDRLRPLLAQALALDLPLELEAGTTLQRLEVGDDVAVLALAAGLLDVTALGSLDRLGDRFAVRDLRATNIRGNFELTAHAVDDDLEVQLPHP
jgi:hypothetical protein